MKIAVRSYRVADSMKADLPLISYLETGIPLQQAFIQCLFSKLVAKRKQDSDAPHRREH